MVKDDNTILNEGLRPRNILSFWPMLLCLLPFIYSYIVIYAYTVKGADLNNQDFRSSYEIIALPLVLVSVLSFGLLAWKKRNEFALVMFVLSTGFFCREWHFVGTSSGIYVVLAVVAGWFILRSNSIDKLIKGEKVERWLAQSKSFGKLIKGTKAETWLLRNKSFDELIKSKKVEIWLWGTFLCYALGQLVARRVFGPKYLNLLPMEDTCHILFEETIESMAHILLAMTSFAAWRQFTAKSAVEQVNVETSKKPIMREQEVA